MEINSINFVSACKEVVVDLSLLFSAFKAIVENSPATQAEIQMLDGQFGEILGRMNDVITFAGQSKLMADMICEELKAGLELTSAILQEKTRILKATMAADDFNIGNPISLN